MRRFPLYCLGWALAGCTGQPVDPPSTGGDAATDATSEVPTDAFDASAEAAAGCDAVAGNLAQNPSFELATAGVLAAWRVGPGGTLAQRLGDAAHCGAWAEVTLPAASSSFPVYVYQDIPLDPPAPKGTRITARLWVRTLDADVTGHLRVGAVSGGYATQQVVLPASGAWKEVAIDWPLPDESAGTVYLSFGSESALLTSRTIGIDGAVFVVTPP